MLDEEETACARGNIPDLDVDVASLVVLLDVDVDGKVSVDVSHLVLVALRYADDQVVDVGTDGSEGGDVLAGAVVDLDVDDILLGLGEVDSQVAQVLGKLASGTLDGDIPRLDVDLDCIGDRMVSKYVWKVESIMKIAFCHSIPSFYFSQRIFECVPIFQ